MLINLFNTVRTYGVPVSLKEFLDLLKALEKQLIFANWNDFYFLSRTILVKDEKYFDKFDRAFDVYFRGIETCNWYAAKIVKRYGNYSYYYAVPQEHKATAYCKPVWVSKDTKPMYDH